jgi:hypothetical protein
MNNARGCCPYMVTAFLDKMVPRIRKEVCHDGICAERERERARCERFLIVSKVL